MTNEYQNMRRWTLMVRTIMPWTSITTWVTSSTAEWQSQTYGRGLQQYFYDAKRRSSWTGAMCWHRQFASVEDVFNPVHSWSSSGKQIDLETRMTCKLAIKVGLGTVLQNRRPKNWVFVMPTEISPELGTIIGKWLNELTMSVPVLIF